MRNGFLFTKEWTYAINWFLALKPVSEELNINITYEHSEYQYKIAEIKGETGSADCDSYICKFAKIASNENLNPEPISNAYMTALNWHCVLRKTLTT